MTLILAVLGAVALAAIAVEPKRQPTLAPYVLLCPYCDGCLGRHSPWCAKEPGRIRQYSDPRKVSDDDWTVNVTRSIASAARLTKTGENL